MDSKIILKAESLDGYLTEKDQAYLAQMDALSSTYRSPTATTSSPTESLSTTAS